MTKFRLLFDVSWEVCNMVGGIHTVLATKATQMREYYEDNYIAVGPDVSESTSLGGVFEEDVWQPELLDSLASLPVKVRMGRWLVAGKPRCLLIDFKRLFESKDQILAHYWERYGLNSLLGGGDYFEPVMFAQGAGMVIDRLFSEYFLPRGWDAVAHCHEWLAGAALLYLREHTPEVGTVFTTHATMLGRALSSKHIDFDSLRGSRGLDSALLAQQHGVTAKHSLETVCAHVADCFTTVSNITAAECELLLGKRPDLITPNGLDETTPDPKYLEPAAVQKSRERLLQIAGLVTGTTFDAKHTLLTMSAGRYEFENKGIDLVLDAAAKVSHGTPGQRVVLFLMLPAGHTGPRPELARADTGSQGHARAHFISSHGLADEKSDPVLKRCASLGLTNAPDAAVHVVFLPIYLNGADPLIAETYYELLPGMDLTLFPSSYEPWGYTPQESIAAKVPTVTSDMAGFGEWASHLGDWNHLGVYVLRRHHVSIEQARDDLAGKILEFSHLNAEERDKLRGAARALSLKTLWAHFAEEYHRAHGMAARQAQMRTQSANYDRFRSFAFKLRPLLEGIGAAAHTRKIEVFNKLPPQLDKLNRLTEDNLWWSWNSEGGELFSALDPELWEKCGRNPTTFLSILPATKLEEAAKSRAYLDRLDSLVARSTRETAAKSRPEIAYFCMEYGLSHLLRIYSGGLGILAGDYLKTASDMGVPLCAFGLAYREGYFVQRIAPDGHQEAIHEESHFDQPPQTPVLDKNGEQLRFSIPAPDGPVFMQAWKVGIGSVDLYLLDTNLTQNSPNDRMTSDRLYGGGFEHRLHQEYVLAIGGLRLLRILGIEPKIFHMNEGHTAFLVLARMAELIRERDLSYYEAFEVVRHSTVFTIHTPVPAGHDEFPEGRVTPYLSLFEAELGKEGPRRLGSAVDASRGAVFSMTALAVRGSVNINGVSKIHGEVSRHMFHSMIPQFHPSEVPVDHVTNGVHAATWIAPQWQRVFVEKLGGDWRTRLTDAAYWARVRELDPELVWDVHLQLKRKLIAWLKEHIRETWTRRKEPAANLGAAIARLNENAFIATFARRFAPYKRANLVLRDPARLEKLVSADGPVVFLFAGKAHPSDTLGQAAISQVIELARNPKLAGNIIFIENYEMDAAQLLVAGSDIWISNPIRPLEASGTSGMKAGMNGCLNLGVADGWWAEGYNGANGWVIGDMPISESAEYQDAFDSAFLYTLLERDVIPEFRRKDGKGIPTAWIQRMKESIASIVPAFNTERMLSEYRSKFYIPARAQTDILCSENYAAVKKIVASRKRLVEHWSTVAFADIDVKGLESERVQLGQPAHLRVTINHPHVHSHDLQVQTVLSPEFREGDGIPPDPDRIEFQLFRCHCTSPVQDSERSVWEADFRLLGTGPQSLGIRVLPRACHENHNVDLTLGLVKWL